MGNPTKASKKYPGVSSKQLKNGNIAYYIKFRDEFGRSRREKVGENNANNYYTVSDAHKALLKRKTDINQGVSIPKPKKSLKIADLADLWLESRKNKSSARNLANDRSLFKLHIEPFFGTKSPERLTLQDIEDFKYEKLKTYSEATVRNMLTALKSTLNYAIKNDIIKTNLAKKIIIKKVDNQRQRYLKIDEINTLYETLKDNQDLYVFTKVALNTGARLEGILNIKKVDIQENNLVLKDYKSNSTYSTYIKDELKQLILDYSSGISITTPIFHKLKKRSMQSDLLDILNILFNKNLDPKDTKNRAVIHTFRHTFASHLAINGTPIFTIKKLMNHMSIETTMKYAKLSPNTSQDAIDSLNF